MHAFPLQMKQYQVSVVYKKPVCELGDDKASAVVTVSVSGQAVLRGSLLYQVVDDDMDSDVGPLWELK